jgi:N-acetylmuramoyl-L-alanine amidase
MIEIRNHILFINSKSVDYRPSPNHGGIIMPEYLIIHYTAAKTANSAINWMMSKDAKVSAHLHIARDGNVVQLVPFNIKAWHAGASSWNGLTGLNSYSIGIELQNDSKEDYTPIQLDVAKDISRLLVTRYCLKDILGHSDISPGRKVDPGIKFPMQLFKSAVFCT